MIVDAYDEALKIKIANSFKSNLIRFYYGNDVIGSKALARSFLYTLHTKNEDFVLDGIAGNFLHKAAQRYPAP